VRGAAGMLADGTGALLLAARAVLQPLLQATRIKNHEAIAGLGPRYEKKRKRIGERRGDHRAWKT
jgi:hypothetical protein